MTTPQVTDLAFTGQRRTEQRLAVLLGWDVVDRFRPRTRHGAGPYHWVLGAAGAAVLDAEDGTDPAKSSWRRDTTIALARNSQLSHLVGINGLFTALIRASRTDPDAELVEWWSEARCAAEWGALVRPDGYGVWHQANRTMPFLLEYDNGTEQLARLTDKLVGYDNLAAEAGHPTWVCFRFPTPGREATARPALRHPRVPVATCVLALGADPSQAIWQPVGASGPRVTLANLDAEAGANGSRR